MNRRSAPRSPRAGAASGAAGPGISQTPRAPAEAQGYEQKDRLLLALGALDDDALTTLSMDLGVELAEGDANFKKFALVRDFESRGQLDVLEDAIERASTIRKLRMAIPSAPEKRPEHRSVAVFVSYSHKDQKLREELGKDLELLEEDGFVQVWHDGMISAGDEFNEEIAAHLDHAHVILLLVSRPFLHSRYIRTVELPRAMARHEAGDARVIPIILKPAPFTDPPWSDSFGKLNVLPRNGRPISKWRSRDDAFVEIYRAMLALIKDMSEEQPGNGGQ